MSLDYSFNATLLKFEDSPLWGHHIVVPNDIATPLIKSSNRRVLTRINESSPSHQALMPNGKGGFFLTINKEIRTKLKLTYGDVLRIVITPDHSKYGMAVPEEFTELLTLDEEGAAVFHDLTIGKQRALIHQIATPKRSETRIKRALVIIDYLKSVNGKLDFKDLNTALKSSKY